VGCFGFLSIVVLGAELNIVCFAVVDFSLLILVFDVGIHSCALSFIHCTVQRADAVSCCTFTD
jgi:hypothetical protein